MTNDIGMVRKIWGGGERGRSFLYCWMDMLGGAKIQHSTYRVLMTMAQRFQSHEGHEYGFTVDQLAEVTGMSASTIKRAWKEGRKAGWLYCARQGRKLPNGETTLSYYRATIPEDAEWPTYLTHPKVPKDADVGVTGEPHDVGVMGDTHGGVVGVTGEPVGVTGDPLDRQVLINKSSIDKSSTAADEEQGVVNGFTDDEWDAFLDEIDGIGHRPEPRKSNMPDWKQRELYERNMAENEGLNEYGEPLGLDY